MSIITELNMLIEADAVEKKKALNTFKKLPPEDKEKLKNKDFDPSEKKKARAAIDKVISTMDDKKAIKSVEKIDKNINKLNGKVDNKMLDGIKKTLEMVKDGLAGKYPLPKRTLFMIIANLLYVISPIDIVPEIFLGPIGYIDDVGVWASLYPAIQQDLIEWGAWKIAGGGKVDNIENVAGDTNNVIDKAKAKKAKAKTPKIKK